MNEAEIRGRIIDVWLRDHGFGPHQIRLEKTFKIRLGRASHTVGSCISERLDVCGRCDYLVRAVDGRNLFIIEAKAEGEPIDEETVKQGVSYARLLENGGIAPFVVATNGRDTAIIDTISGLVVGDTGIPRGHRYVTNGFRVCGDDLESRSEALEHFIGLSADNLLAFCRSQVGENMSRLRSDDPRSGLKYIPSLYVGREREQERLCTLVETHASVLVLGPPQTGKTNFVCHFVEEQLRQHRPCLFYAAAGMRSGLIDAITQDFEWRFGDSSSAIRVVRNKLGRILKSTNSRLLIFVEGVNENRDLIHSLEFDLQRLSIEGICVVISFATYAAARILLDPAGNPTYTAKSAGVELTDIPALEIDSSTLPRNMIAVHIGHFSQLEVQQAYKVYSWAFAVKVPNEHRRTNQPLLLRNAMTLYEGRCLPAVLDASDVLCETISHKLSRLGTAVGVNLGRDILIEAGRQLCEGEQLTELWFCQNSFQFTEFVRVALLTTLPSSHSFSLVDFYVTSERAFVVSHWVRKWPSVLRNAPEAVGRELEFAVVSEVTREALRWFLKQPVNRDIVCDLAERLAAFNSVNVRRQIILSLCDYLATTYDEDDYDDEFRDRVSELITEFGMEMYNQSSEAANILATLILQDSEDLEIRCNCAVGLANFSCDECISVLGRLSRQTPREALEAVCRALEPGFKKCVAGILEQYYGPMMCKGLLHHLDHAESRLEEYEKVIQGWRPAIAIFKFSKAAQELEELLQELNPRHPTIPDQIRQSSLF